MRLYLVDGCQYKDMIAGRLHRPNGPGAWMVFKGCDRDYTEQICAEEKVLEKKGGRQVEVWRPKSSHAANHYLDAEVYAALAADLLHVRYLRTGDNAQEAPRPEPKPAAQGDLLKTGKPWLNQKGGWIK
jgi:phage terminase large subunit GpA-like protein